RSELTRAENLAGSGSQWQVKRDHVRFSQGTVELGWGPYLNPRNLQRLLIESNNLQPHCQSDSGYPPPDLAYAQQEQPFPAQLSGHQMISRYPLPRPNRLVAYADRTCEREHQGYGVLGDRLGVRC